MRCKAKKWDGEQCTREAEPGSEYCWQHGNPERMGGRPRKFTDPAEVQAAIEAYFAECDRRNKPATITGLAIALGTTRQGLFTYQNDPNLAPFNDIIKAAKERVRSAVEERLLEGGGTAAGLIFWLKNNAGWADRQQVQVEGKHEVTVRARLEDWFTGQDKEA